MFQVFYKLVESYLRGLSGTDIITFIELFCVSGELWIIYTDYYNFMVYFICYGKIQNNCLRPEVAFMSRKQKVRLQDLRIGQSLIKDLCVKPKAFLDKIQDVGN